VLRSEINAAIEAAKSAFLANGFHLPPFAFWAPEDWKKKGPECGEIRACTARGSGAAVVGEVSSIHDDATDNRFLEAPARFPAIVEDEKPSHLLCTES
jgi:D-lyxose ketol-isomerase